MIDINNKEISKAFENSYKLLMGETTYEELGRGGIFILPEKKIAESALLHNIYSSNNLFYNRD